MIFNVEKAIQRSSIRSEPENKKKLASLQTFFEVEEGKYCVVISPKSCQTYPLSFRMPEKSLESIDQHLFFQTYPLSVWNEFQSRRLLVHFPPDTQISSTKKHIQLCQTSHLGLLSGLLNAWYMSNTVTSVYTIRVIFCFGLARFGLSTLHIFLPEGNMSGFRWYIELSMEVSWMNNRSNWSVKWTWWWWSLPLWLWHRVDLAKPRGY